MGANLGKAAEVRVHAVYGSQRGEKLLRDLICLWEEAVRATHTFLEEEDIIRLRPFVGQGLAGIPHLYVACQGGKAVAFMGVEGEKIEMLFVAPRCFGQGIGSQLVGIAVEHHQATLVDVNEQNPQARAFYERTGFVVFEKTKTDGQGNPFPILRMKLREVRLMAGRLVLRPLRTEDVDSLHAFMGRKDVMYAWEHGFTKAEVREWINRQICRYHADGIGYWGVAFSDAPGTLVGQAGLVRTTLEGKDAVELGYIFHDACWHKGYATKAARLCLAYAFGELGLDKVYCTIRPMNESSVRLAQRLGMTKCGVVSKPYRGKDLVHDIYLITKAQFI